MGDGRYYTYDQFFDVILLTFLTMFAVGSMIACHYRRNRDHTVAHINIPFILIIFVSVMRMVETVIPNLSYASMLRSAECGAYILLIVLFSLDKKIITYHYKLIIAMLIFMEGVALFGGTLVERYAFHNVMYSPLYQALLVVSFILWLVVYLKDLLMTKESVHKKQLLCMKLCTLLIPISIYLIMLVNHVAFTEYFELLLLTCFTIYLDLIFHLNSEASLTMLAFDKIGDVSTNYIFVIDETYKLIYKNQAAVKSGFFAEVSTIDISDVTSMFKGESIKNKTHLGKEYIMLNINNDKHYFTYKATYLNNERKHIGYIITITNITDLITLLVNLENKKEESRIVNQKLKNHSKVVYHLEKEKEINHLLEEIVSSRDAQMNYLSELIAHTKDKIDDARFEKYIDVTISSTNDILEEVRDTVSKYREYYGG